MSSEKSNETEKFVISIAKTTAKVSILAAFSGLIFVFVFIWKGSLFPISDVPVIQKKVVKISVGGKTDKTGKYWSAPTDELIPAGKYGNMIRYGRELVSHTARYYGPHGSLAKISNGMNCQNCHLQGGTKIFANNFSVFFASYPKMGARSGKKEVVFNRIFDCFNRSLNGKAPAAKTKEIQSMLAYMKWLGAGVKKGMKVFGTASEKLKYMDKPADPVKGRLVYLARCASCHKSDGGGTLSADKKEYTYPPLWGANSYNDGAGLFRLSNFAGFVKNNMPFGTSYPNAQLSDAEAWDVAAFVNSQARPHKDPSKDYPDLKKKPIDAPFGPYADKFTANQHKFGPFAPIAVFYKNLNKLKT